LTSFTLRVAIFISGLSRGFSFVAVRVFYTVALWLGKIQSLAPGGLGRR